MLDLRSNSLLDDIVECYHSRIAGEDNNIKICFLVGLSKFLPPKMRNHLIVFGQSSAGKSYLVHNVFSVFDEKDEYEYDQQIIHLKMEIERLKREMPRNEEARRQIEEFKKELLKISNPWSREVIHITRITKAGIDRAGINVDGKILLFEQIAQTEGEDPTMVNMRALLSEGRLVLVTAERDPETGDFKSVVIPTIGMPVLVCTSTRYSIDPEFENRVVELSIDESEEQTKNIMQKTAEDFIIPLHFIISKDRIYEVRQLVKTIKELLDKGEMTNQVIIPYAKLLIEKFPTVLTARRDFKKALTLTYAYTFLYQKQRPIITLKKHNAIVTRFAVSIPEDFEEVCKFAAKTLYETLTKIKHVEFELLQAIIKNNWYEFTVRDVVAAKIVKYSTRYVRDMLHDLAEKGYLAEERKGRAYTYTVVKDPGEIQIMIDDLKVQADGCLNELIAQWQKEGYAIEINWPDGRIDVYEPEQKGE